MQIREATIDDLGEIVALLADDQLGRGREDPATIEPYRRAFDAIDRDPHQTPSLPVQEALSIQPQPLTSVDPGLDLNRIPRRGTDEMTAPPCSPRPAKYGSRHRRQRGAHRRSAHAGTRTRITNAISPSSRNHPTSSSWTNLVERWFGLLTNRQLTRSSFESVHDLIDTIDEWADTWNTAPRPFSWTADPADIIAKVQRARQALNHQTESLTEH